MTHPRSAFAAPPPGQRGLALIVVLIALVIMLISAVALVRSLDVSMVQAGNLAFKRDLKNEAERGVQAALNLLSKGALSAEAARNADARQHNYSAAKLDANGSGIPLALVDDEAYASAGFAASDIVDASTGVTVRYLIDRQCAAPGEVTSTACVTYTAKRQRSCDLDDCLKHVDPQARPVYRISVRATGPRNTQVFIQTTVSR